ncbi:hypothetical protein DCCM_0116 [Desulfocucumis palustris]|uniref:Uncharacterized protein n=1 Tax=Desulfocucumis palustris TaxID=1898651 RepID=A0A2L2X7I6_9FIRM|nr:hypothetical protein DCCM_0116 [Desulfocucumis palustris]
MWRINIQLTYCFQNIHRFRIFHFFLQEISEYASKIYIQNFINPMIGLAEGI